jgi:integrase
VVLLIAAQARRRDRVALELLFRLGLRKGELQGVRFRDFDHARRRLRIQGKGGKIAQVPIPWDDLRVEISALVAERNPHPSEHLLFPEKLGPRAGRGPVDVLWEDRRRPMSSTALHRWWHGCLERAALPARPMHEARHTAITDFIRRTGNLKLAQQLARHESISTTADIYGHLDDVDLERALAGLEFERSADNRSDRG